MRVRVQTVDGVFDVELETEEVVAFEPAERLVPEPEPRLELPLVVAAAASGSTVAAVVERRPPVVVSYDAGHTWSETGGGLPPGRAIAVAADDPDHIVYGARNRLYVSRDGGRFWRALTPELPEIERIAFAGW